MTVFEIVSVLTLMSYASTNHKIQCKFLSIILVLFNVFDLEANKALNFKELILLFVSLIRGYCIVTGQPLPEHSQLQKYAHTLFARADLNNDQNLEIGEYLFIYLFHRILGWFESNTDGVALFGKY
jgi:hypothetical protein